MLLKPQSLDLLLYPQAGWNEWIRHIHYGLYSCRMQSPFYITFFLESSFRFSYISIGGFVLLRSLCRLQCNIRRLALLNDFPHTVHLCLMCTPCWPIRCNSNFLKVKIFSWQRQHSMPMVWLQLRLCKTKLDLRENSLPKTITEQSFKLQETFHKCSVINFTTKRTIVDSFQWFPIFRPKFMSQCEVYSHRTLTIKNMPTFRTIILCYES